MIRNLRDSDLPEVFRVYEGARKIMAESGNPTQWGNFWPPRFILRNDVTNQTGYVVERNGRVCACFALVFGEDSTYRYIEGQWLSSAPYGTLHRIGSDGTEKGILNEVLDFCESKISHMRVDTHGDNVIMRHLLEKRGYCYCGTIYTADGGARRAYEKV